MGWIAGAGCALIAAVVLYRLYSGRKVLLEGNLKPSQATEKGSKDETTGNAPVNLVPEGELINISKVSGANGVIRPLSAPTPSISLSSNSEQQPKTRVQVERIKPVSPSEAAPAPTISMAPPPPPTRSKSPPRLKPPSFGPAPPRPGGGSLRPPPSAASSLRVPQTKVLSNTSMAPSASPSSLMPPPKKPSKQVILEPGHSPLDWAALTTDPKNNLRGKDAPTQLSRITPSQLKAQNGRKGKDAWTVYQGKVYNITPYVPFHPGGKGEILRGAAKDSAKLFMEVHPWVNWDGMLGECMVGILVGEGEGGESEDNRLDEMD